MRFMHQGRMTNNEVSHSVEPDEAVRLFQRSLEVHEPIDGLLELRGGSWDMDVIERLKQGEWQLVDTRAYRFDWSLFDRWASEKKLHIRSMELMEGGHAVKNIVGAAVGIHASYRGGPLQSRDCTHGAEGERVTARTGVAGLVDCPHVSHNDRMLVSIDN